MDRQMLAGIRNAHLAAHLGHLRSRLSLLQRKRDILFRELRRLHGKMPPPVKGHFARNLYFWQVRFSWGRSQGVGIRKDVPENCGKRQF